MHICRGSSERSRDQNQQQKWVCTWNVPEESRRILKLGPVAHCGMSAKRFWRLQQVRWVVSKILVSKRLMVSPGAVDTASSWQQWSPFFHHLVDSRAIGVIRRCHVLCLVFSKDPTGSAVMWHGWAVKEGQVMSFLNWSGWWTRCIRRERVEQDGWVFKSCGGATSWDRELSGINARFNPHSQ